MPDNIILTGAPVVIALGGTLSTGFDLKQRPLSWVQLPNDWPANTPLSLQAAVTESMPATGSVDWRDVVDRTGAAITLTGAAGQIVALDPGMVMGFRWLRLKAAAAQTAERSIQWGSWYLT